MLIPGPLAGSESLVFHRVEISRTAIGHRLKDLGSVNAPPPLDHRDSGVGWSGGTAILLQRVMPLAKIL